MMEPITRFFNDNPLLIYAGVLGSGLFLAVFLGSTIFHLLKKLSDKAEKKLSVLKSVFHNYRLNNLLFGMALSSFAFVLIFPIDKETAHTLTKWGVVSFMALLTIIGADLLVRIIISTEKDKDHGISSILQFMIKAIAYLLGLMVIFNYLDIQLAPILTALGVGGLAVALALQDTLSNLFAGMQILATKQLMPGDFIKLETGEEGYILDIKWRNTELKTLLENIIIIPNSKLANSISRNYFMLHRNLYFHVLIGVDYSSNLEQVEKIVLEEATALQARSPFFPNSYEPRVRFYEFGDSSVNFKVWLAADYYENQFLLTHEFIKSIHARFKDEGIVIPFPIRTVYMQNTNS